MSLQPVPHNNPNQPRSRSPSPANHGANQQHKAPAATHVNARQTRRNTPADTFELETTHPLMAAEKVKPPLAHPETDEDRDDREVVNQAYPGVDDGFFSNRANEDAPTNPQDVESVPAATPALAVPDIRPPEDDDRRSHTPKGPAPKAPRHDPRVPDFVGSDRPTAAFPTYTDLEFGTIAPDLETIPDLNVYQHKKTLAQGMMDLALFSANANQLRYVLDSSTHPYYYSGIVLISISLIFQVLVGVGLIWNARYNVKDEKEICIANKINNFTIIGIFLVTVINVFISAFGVASVQPVIVRSGP